jgi:hypothetical protein
MNHSPVSRSADGTQRATLTPLLRERRFLDAHRGELAARYRGLFLLVKGTRLVGAYPDVQTAYREGSSRFGWEPFLVQQI